MKTKPYQNITALTAALALSLAGIGYAQETKKPAESKEHADHDAKKIAGPNGGRVLTGVEPHLEFFVTKDRKVKITAVDDAGKAVALGEQSVTVTGGDRSKPTQMSFTKEGESLISDNAFPEGNNLPVIVQIKAKPDAKAVIEKFTLNLSDCPTCEHAEYACTCAHGGDEKSKEKGHEGHDH